MEKYSFTDIVDFVGSACKYFDCEKCYISTGAVNIDKIDDACVEIITYNNRPSRANLQVTAGNLLFAKMQGTKKTLYIDEQLADNIYSTGFSAVSPKHDIITEKCLYYLLSSNTFLSQKDKYCSGATQKAITNAGLSKIILQLPSTEQQEMISCQFEVIASIIQKRKDELAALDDLIKARFVEMFGSLDCPANKFKMDTLAHLCYKITDGKHGGCTTEVGTGKFFVGAREIFDDVVHYETAPEINIREFEKDYKRCNLTLGDLMIVNTGATIGKSAIAIDERTESTLLQKSVALIRVNPNKLNTVFLKWCFRVNHSMYFVKSASAQPNLLLSKIKSTEIYVPDINLQNQFAAFVAQVDKSKFVVQKALDKAQMLFDSLMQQYFG